jgi:protoporphyrinogen IX oxidase
MLITWLKAVHIVFIVSWFAALFYIVRLFIYAAEAQLRDEPAKQILTTQLLLMQRRLWYIIGWPALGGTLITGIWMILLNSSYYLSQQWMLLKLGAVLILVIYHLFCQRILNAQHKMTFKYSSLQLRLLNELATVLLVAIVFLVVVKSTAGLVYGVTGLIGFGLLLMVAVLIYKRARR